MNTHRDTEIHREDHTIDGSDTHFVLSAHLTRTTDSITDNRHFDRHTMSEHTDESQTPHGDCSDDGRTLSSVSMSSCAFFASSRALSKSRFAS